MDIITIQHRPSAQHKPFCFIRERHNSWWELFIILDKMDTPLSWPARAGMVWTWFLLQPLSVHFMLKCCATCLPSATKRYHVPSHLPNPFDLLLPLPWTLFSHFITWRNESSDLGSLASGKPLVLRTYARPPLCVLLEFPILSHHSIHHTTVITSFTSIPFSILNLTTLVHWRAGTPICLMPSAPSTRAGLSHTQ
jgi:hypothetical protein